MSNSTSENVSALWDNATAAGLGYTAPTLQVLIPILLFLAAAIFIASFGNLFTISVYLRYAMLRTPFNTYIFNLAIADFFVGALVMPCYAIYNSYGYWPFGEPMCSVWVFTDWFMTFESVMSLAIISMERLWSITWPVSYKQKNTLKFTAITVLISWLYTCCVWMPPFFFDRLNHNNVPEDCSWDPSKNLVGGSFLGILGYLLPFTVMIICYLLVGWKMRKRRTKVIPRRHRDPDFKTISSHGEGGSVIPSSIGITTLESELGTEKTNGNSRLSKVKRAITVKKDRSALITLGAILLAFCACWLPFYVYFYATLYNTITLSDQFLTATYWLAYLNSAFNPLLNTILHRDFRIKFLELVKCRQ